MSNITVVDKLGGLCAFKPKEIQVRADIMATVPENKRAEFEQVLENTRAAYDKAVADAKAKGEKPKAIALKNKAIEDILEPWLKQVAPDSSPAKVVREKAPAKAKTSKTETSQTNVPKRELGKATAEQVERAKEIYDNNFPVDALEDSKPEVTKSETDDLFLDDEEDLFSDDIIITSTDGGIVSSADDVDSNGISFDDEDDSIQIPGDPDFSDLESLLND